jgi:mannose-1-phosphate guanylyltransferase
MCYSYSSFESSQGQKLKAFLLVAGRGKRLRPLTDNIPKCLLPFNGKPLLEIWLEHLVCSGIDEVLINTHWLHDQVTHFVEKWLAEHKQIRIILFHEPVLLGSGGTLWANREWAGCGPFFIIYGDNLTRFDLRKMLSFHNKYRQPLTIRTYRGADPERAGVVCVDQNDIVTDFEEKPLRPKSDLGAGGIYVADERIFDFFPAPNERKPGAVLDMSRHILPRMVGRMKAYGSGEFSMDIGTIDSLTAARKKWREMSREKT